jgi:cyclin-dependent kinase 8/11
MSDSDWSAAAFASDPMKFWRPRRDAAHVAVNSKYRILGFISSGTYGRVYKAESLDGAGVMCAIKKFKPDKDATDGAYTGISQSAIREIAVSIIIARWRKRHAKESQLNRELVHENIVALREVILEDKAIHMVFEYAEHDFLVRIPDALRLAIRLTFL